MIIVTGGAGFIGSNIVKMLNEQGREDIVIVDDLTEGKKFLNLSCNRFHDYMDKDDFLAMIKSDKAFDKKIDVIFHQGACSTTTEWDGKFMMQNNYEYSKVLLHYCLSKRIPFIYASSAAVYGGNQIFVEEPANEAPLNVYGYSKLAFDNYVRRLLPTAHSQVVGLRYFNVYGPHEQHKGSMASVAFHFNNQLLDNGEVCLFEGTDGYENGEQMRDFVFVDDVVAVNDWFFKHKDSSGIYNVGTGRSQSFNEVADSVIAFHGRGEKRYIPFPDHLKGAYQSFTQAALTRLRGIGCDVEFKTVQQAVPLYLDSLQNFTA